MIAEGVGESVVLVDQGVAFNILSLIPVGNFEYADDEYGYDEYADEAYTEFDEDEN